MLTLQTQRFERRYPINEDRARQIGEVVRAHLNLDEHSLTLPDHAYPVRSIYLDSGDQKLLRAAIDQDRNRYKLRLRIYDSGPDAPAFCEIKRRANNCMLKQRACLRRNSFPEFLQSLSPDRSFLLEPSPGAVVALTNFCELSRAIQARPSVSILLRREAYDSADGTVRVTLDREMRRRLIPATWEGGGNDDETDAQPVFSHPTVVLRLKFTRRFPDWWRERVAPLAVDRTQTT